MKRGFTLIELLVVIAILSVLLGTVFVNLRSSREKSRRVEAKGDVSRIANAVQLLFADTRLFPGYIGKIGKDVRKFAVSSAESGLVTGTKCPNTPGCYNNWRGPYLSEDVKDPWGHDYFIDYSYYGYPSDAVRQVVVSYGANFKGNMSAEEGMYDCDDTYFELGSQPLVDATQSDKDKLASIKNANKCQFNGRAN